MQQYLALLENVMNNGVKKNDRTGTGTISIFGHQMRFDLSKGFPLLTTKKVHLKSIIHELLWFLAGKTDNGWLTNQGVTIWNEWASQEQCARFGRKAGDLGPIYGHQWRNFGASQLPDGTYAQDGLDQIKSVLVELQQNPDSRRLIVSAWNPREQNLVALPPCHSFFQFYVAEGRLSCQLYQRSGDIFLGIPFNIASYALLTMMFAHVCQLLPGDFIHTIGDAHLYTNHLEQAKLQLSRTPYSLPQMVINPKINNIFDFTFEDFTLLNYNSHPAIKAPVAI